MIFVIHPSVLIGLLKDGLRFHKIIKTTKNIVCDESFIIWVYHFHLLDICCGHFKILAQSNFFPAKSPSILVTPSYGSIIYELLNNGHIMALQVAPANNKS